jgi:SAM-dependent methyltransferase
MKPVALFQALSAGKVLDVATGQGGFVHFLVDNLHSFAEITGIDTQPAHAATFSQAFNGRENIHFVQMDAQHMDFAAETFDTVCIANSLHHLPAPLEVLVEMRRVLTPGGHLIVYEMYHDGQSKPQLTHVLLHHWWAAVDTAMGICHRQTYTRHELIDLVNRAGLQELEFYDDNEQEGDPCDPETLQQLEPVIDRYIARATGQPEQDALQQRGEELRQRLYEIGFLSASSLLAWGTKS